MGWKTTEFHYILTFPVATLLGCFLCALSLRSVQPVFDPYILNMYFALFIAIIGSGIFGALGMILLRLIVHQKYAWGAAFVCAIVAVVSITSPHF